MSFVEGIKAIPVDLARVRTREGKMRRAAEIGKILVDEIRGVVSVIPYGIRAMRQHRRLPDAVSRGRADAPVGVSIVRDVRYADAPRAVMDVYLPAGVALEDAVPSAAASPAPRRAERNRPSNAAAAAAAASPSNSNPDETASDGLPVALFVHGGVWAVGEKWQFAPMASRLAEEGVVACVATYTLFPDALAPRMWAEVSDAVTFAIDNARRFGGSGDKVTLVGHSAGAHICAMALLERCRAADDDARNRQSSPGGTPISGSDRGERSDPRQPRRFVGLCGVYDIAKHYAYEDGRGVALISTMARAMGGRERFDACSPTKAVERGGANYSDAPESDADARASSDASSPPLTPISPPRRVAAASAAWVPMGIMDTDEMVDVDTILAATNAMSPERRRGGGPAAETLSRNRKPKPERTKPSGPPPTPRTRRGGITGPAPGSFAGDDAAALAGYLRDDDDEAGFLSFAARDASTGPAPAGRFPPSYLFAGCADVTVPWVESAAFHLALRDAGCASRVLLYLKEPHASFVLGWRPRPEARPARASGRDDGGANARRACGGFGDPAEWGDGMDGSIEEAGLTPHGRDLIRVLKYG